MAVITVGQLNNYVKRYIDSNKALASLWIKGEISNFKHHSSGHMYMTLKDDTASVKCVMFQSYASRLNFRPENGMRVIVLGKISVYERDGVYQLYAEQLVPDGTGELYAAYEQLKSELEKSGYFEESAKKPIPRYPASIGIVTSPQGAALQDMLNILSRRYPCAEIYVYPALVQGVGSAATIARGIEYFNTKLITDTIIIGRGGGSIEDLWAFNEKTVADAIYMSNVPVISAVGHETDFTIADFCADLRAPTPSAAAELAVPDIFELHSYIRHCNTVLNSSLEKLIINKKSRLKSAIDKDISRLALSFVQDKILLLDSYSETLGREYCDAISSIKVKFETLCTKLDALSPLKVLSRGYAVVSDNNGTLRSVTDADIGQEISVQLSDGCLDCRIDKINVKRGVTNAKG